MRSDNIPLIVGVRPPLASRDEARFHVPNLGFQLVQESLRLRTSKKVLVHTHTEEYARILQEFPWTPEQMGKIVSITYGDLTDPTVVESIASVIKDRLGDERITGVALTPGDFPRNPSTRLSQREHQRIIGSNYTAIQLPVRVLLNRECVASNVVIVTFSVVTSQSMAQRGEGTGWQRYGWEKCRVEDWTRHMDTILKSGGGRAFVVKLGVLSNTPPEWYPEGFDHAYVVRIEDAAHRVDQLINPIDRRILPEEGEIILDGGWTVQPGDGFWG